MCETCDYVPVLWLRVTCQCVSIRRWNQGRKKLELKNIKEYSGREVQVIGKKRRSPEAVAMARFLSTSSIN